MTTLPDLRAYDPARFSDEDLIEQRLRFLRAGGQRPASRRLQLSYLRRLSDHLGSVGLLAATRGDLVDFLAAGNWKPETRKSARSVLRGFYDWAVEEELLDVDPAVKLPKVRVPAGQPRPVPETVLGGALSAADDETVLMLLLGAFAGLRLAEIARVHSDDVTDQGLRVCGKGGRTRLVPIHERLAESLAALDGWAFPAPTPLHEQIIRALTAAGPDGLTGGQLRDLLAVPAGEWSGTNRALRLLLDDGRLLPAGSRGRLRYVLAPGVKPGPDKPVSVDYVTNRVRPLLGGPYTTHTLRHRFASAVYAGSHDLRAVQVLLGHSSVATTERYTLVDQESLAAAVRTLR